MDANATLSKCSALAAGRREIDVSERSGGTIPVFNRSNEEQIGEVPDADQAAVDAAVARARETFEPASGVSCRRAPADVLFRAAEIIKARTEELAEIESSRQRYERCWPRADHQGWPTRC